MYLKNLRTGSLWLVLGNAPSPAAVWVQKVDQPRCVLSWSADSMMSRYHDFVAVDKNGEQQRRDA